MSLTDVARGGSVESGCVQPAACCPKASFSAALKVGPFSCPTCRPTTVP